MHVNAYRIAGLVPGSLSLIMADHLPWHWVFPITALFMLPGLMLTLLCNEPASSSVPRNATEAVLNHFMSLFNGKVSRMHLLILAFIFLYKLGDSMATSLATPFYQDIGFSKTEIGLIAKHAGLWPSVIGGMLGGI